MVTDERLADYTRFMHDIESRVLKGSLGLESVMNQLRPLIGQSVNGSRVIIIDRSRPINLKDLLGFGEDWRVVDMDERTPRLTRLDLARVKLEKKQRRVGTEDYLMLDAHVFRALLVNEPCIPSWWKKETNGKETTICFDGTKLFDKEGKEYVLCLTWRGSWHPGYTPCDMERSEHFRQAVIRMS